MYVQAALAFAILLVLIAISLQSRSKGTEPHRLSVGLGTLGGLLGGLAIGAAATFYYEDHASDLSGLDPESLPSAPRPGPPGGAFGGGPPAGGPSGTAGPNPKTQLATLVTKLDQVVDRPLKLELDDKARDAIRTQLDGLEELRELSRDEAKARLQAILEVLKPQRSTLEAAGYRWPAERPAGGMMMMGPSDPPNPFQESGGSAALRSLEERLTPP